MEITRPRSLRSTEVLEERLSGVLTGPVEALNDWVLREEAKRNLSIPRFDPADAGTEAKVMFLLESPGPMADAGRGSGIISVDNNDPTAENLWCFRRNASLVDGCLHWNAVPWYLGSESQGVVTPEPGDVRRGVSMFRALLALLPDLQVVVPMGNAAKQAWGMYCTERPNNYVVVPTWHPAARALTAPGRRQNVQRALDRVAYLL